MECHFTQLFTFFRFLLRRFFFFFFNDTATTEIYTLSLHDALPTLPPHVLHRNPGSMTPRWESMRPMSIGKPSSSYVSAVMIFVADIRRISSGLRRANLID